eukprot:356256-Chlamydomonas_euryale.AAC.2
MLVGSTAHLHRASAGHKRPVQVPRQLQLPLDVDVPLGVVAQCMHLVAGRPEPCEQLLHAVNVAVGVYLPERDARCNEVCIEVGVIRSRTSCIMCGFTNLSICSCATWWKGCTAKPWRVLARAWPCSPSLVREDSPCLPPALRHRLAVRRQKNAPASAVR